MLYFILFSLVIISCNETERPKVLSKEIAAIEFPKSLKKELSDEVQSFARLANDSMKIQCLFQLAIKKPVFQISIYKDLIAQTNDSIHLRDHLYAYRKLSGSFSRNNAIDSVVFYTQEGIRICNNDIRYSYQLSEFYRDLGNIFANFSRNAEAILNFDKAIQIASQSGNDDNLFRYIAETGRIYLSMNELEKAKECFEKGKEYAEKHGNSSLLVYSLNSIGDICRRQKKYEESVDYFQEANHVNKGSNGAGYEQWACTSLGKSYASMGQYDSARKYFNISLAIASGQGSFDIQTQAYLNLSICDKKQKKFPKALDNALNAQKASQKIPSLEVKTAVTENLYELYKETGQFEKAIEFLETMKVLEDSLENTESIKKFAEAEFKTREDRLLYKMEQDQQLYKKEQEKREEEAKGQRIIIISVTFVSILSLTFGFFIFKSFRQIRTKNMIIEQKQSEILQSIKYARRIQNSLLPSEKYIARILKKMNPPRE